MATTDPRPVKVELPEHLKPFIGTYIIEKYDGRYYLFFIERDRRRSIARVHGDEEDAVNICLELNRYVRPQQ